MAQEHVQVQFQIRSYRKSGFGKGVTRGPHTGHRADGTITDASGAQEEFRLYGRNLVELRKEIGTLVEMPTDVTLKKVKEVSFVGRKKPSRA